MNKKKNKNFSRNLFIALRVLTILILIMNIIGLFTQKEGLSNFLFITVQSVLFLMCSYIPEMINKKTKYRIPNFMAVIFLFFCLAHFILGEVNNFFEKIKWWDSMLHTLSGVSLAALGISIVDLLSQSDEKNIHLSPFFKCLFGFMFAIALGAIWEIVEFTIDGLFHTNMQCFYDYVGREALKDTMKDLILDMSGSFLICLISYFKLKKDSHAFEKMSIRKIEQVEEKEEELVKE